MDHLWVKYEFLLTKLGVSGSLPTRSEKKGYHNLFCHQYVPDDNIRWSTIVFEFTLKTIFIFLVTERYVNNC